MAEGHPAKNSHESTHSAKAWRTLGRASSTLCETTWTAWASCAIVVVTSQRACGLPPRWTLAHVVAHSAQRASDAGSSQTLVASLCAQPMAVNGHVMCKRERQVDRTRSRDRYRVLDNDHSSTCQRRSIDWLHIRTRNNISKHTYILYLPYLPIDSSILCRVKHVAI